MAAFSRLRLAAALLEYDNDPENPRAPFRSAKESAIFAHMRGAGRPPKIPGPESIAMSRRSGETGVISQDFESSAWGETRKSRASVSTLKTLKNPFGGGGHEDEEELPEEDEDLEVDLASWGLESLIPKEKPGKKGAKGKERAAQLPNPHPRDDFNGRTSQDRPRSLAGLVTVDDAGPSSTPSTRRNSFANPLDLEDLTGDPEVPPRRRRHSAHDLIESLPVRPPLHSPGAFGGERDTIPFPLSSPFPDGESELAYRTGRRSHDAPSTFAPRTPGADDVNSFAVRLPSPERASKFDPKYASYARENSIAYTGDALDEENQEGRRSSELPRGRDRRYSGGTLGTRNMLDNESQAGEVGYVRERRESKERYSRREIMRPSVLIMPSPLQNAPPPQPQTPGPLSKARDGFILSTDGPPLPPGARTTRPSTFQFPSSTSVPIASNSFTPNPRATLTASQLLFRNALLVDGQRDVTYLDIDGDVKRAEIDGEQIPQEIPDDPPTPEPEPPTIIVPVEEPEIKVGKPPGKLFGRSLIDDLEARKAELRGKKRVFTGDSRPSMMERTPLKRSSTLIDPASLQMRPKSQTMDSFNSQRNQTQSLNRRSSRNSKPLLNFDEEGRFIEENGNLAPDDTMPRSKSVFGTDTLWEREIARLKEIEEQERLDAEAARKREEEEEKKPKKEKKKGKGKKKGKELQPEPEPQTTPIVVEPEPRHSTVLPPVLPELNLPAKKRPPVRNRNTREYSDGESSVSDGMLDPATIAATQAWASDDDRPNRTAGGSRHVRGRSRSENLQRFSRIPAGDDSDSDVPLSQTLQRATRKLSMPQRPNIASDSDEEQPLANIVKKANASATSQKSPSVLPKLDFPTFNEDDDDEPLGVRASRIPLTSRSMNSGGGEDDDDLPLGLHPEQKRRTQFNMAFQQQQNQQMMFQAQMQSAMAFGMPAMPFVPFGPPMQPPPMMPMMIPTAPSVVDVSGQDSANFGRVNQWRYKVAVEGKPEK